jgi:aminoglycoside phosphotransferase (APT) family kinase protein
MSAARIDRQAAFSGTAEVRAPHRFDAAALAAYLGDRIEGFAGPLTVSQFRGGQSNPTYKLVTPSASYVLRRKPPGRLLPSAHAVEREYRATAALHPLGFPVARPQLLCEDTGVIGTAFYVMDFVPGRVFWEPHVPGVTAPERAAIYDSLNATLARLHQVDIEAAGLSDFGRPAGYVQRQIKRWAEQYRASETDKIAEMNRLSDFLPTAVPDSGAVALVHGDYRLDNCIIAADGPQIRAVLDWELSTLGDPLADFTYHLMQWRMPPNPSGAGVGSLGGHEADAPGLPRLEDYVDLYCARTGRTGIPDLDLYLAYNFFRMAAIFQGIVGRVRDGTATNPNAAAVAGQVRPMAEVAWAYARRAGA